ncbi:MAG: aminoacyl-tRNA hydrolase [Candidatus Omnitrophota bacterium]|nr:aminoacyl-tRNA hydrolase [Candidatus Omnitrophota bacterium]
MKIIVGLGNPGIRYRNTRHNVGFQVLSSIAKKHGIALRKKGFAGKYGVGRVYGEETMFFEPRTYMNLSGEAVSAVCSAKLTDKNDLLVISDDLNLFLGNIRIREKGSAGGHNGLRSIISFIGEDFVRLRVGVASGEIPQDTSSYVLSTFSRRERPELEKTIALASDCVETWMKEGTKAAMSLYNRSNNVL